LGILLLLTGLSFRLLLFWRSPTALTITPLGDDSYYTQSHARRISQGHFFSLNDQQKSDAYFPLYTFTCALLHGLAKGDHLLGLRYALGLNFLIFLGCLVTVGFISSRMLHWAEARSRWMLSLLGIAIYACSFIIFNSDMNLMETGLQLLVSLWILYQTLSLYQKKEKEDKDFIYLSSLFVLACLTRIDMALFVAGYSLALLLRRKKWGFNKKRLAIIIIPPALASIAWVTTGYLAKGYWLPTGGFNAFIPSWSLFCGNVTKLSSTFLHFFLGLPHSLQTHPRYTLFWSLWWNQRSLLKICLLLVYLFILVSLIAYFLRRQPVKKERLKYFFYPLVPFVSGILLLVIFYVSCYGRNYFFSRYFTIVVPLFLFFWLTVFALLVEPQGDGKAYHKKVAFVTFLLFSQFIIFTYVQYNIFKILKNGPFLYWAMFDWTKRSTLPEESVASYETGILGYHRNNVINLDGKANLDVAIAIKNTTFAHYVVKIKPKYILDRWGDSIYYRMLNNLPLAKEQIFLKHYELIQKVPFFIWKRKEI
jgi:hypothetical protein